MANKKKLRIHNVPQYKGNVKTCRLGGGGDEEVVDKSFLTAVKMLKKLMILKQSILNEWHNGVPEGENSCSLVRGLG